MATFEVDQIVRHIVNYRKHIKYSQLQKVLSISVGPSGTVYLKVQNLSTGNVQTDVPETEMCSVSPGSLDRLFAVSNRSTSLLE